MSGTRCPRAWDKRPRFTAAAPVALRLKAGKAPTVRLSLPVRPGRRVVAR